MRVLNWAISLLTLALGLWLGLWVVPMIEAGAGGLPLFDLRVTGYGLAEAQAYLAVLSGEGRATYLGMFREADTLFPILLTVTLILPLRGAAAWAFVPALIFGLADLSEDWAVAQILTAGQGLSAGTVALASALTMLKFAALMAAAVVALWGLARKWRRWRRR